MSKQRRNDHYREQINKQEASLSHTQTPSGGDDPEGAADFLPQPAGWSLFWKRTWKVLQAFAFIIMFGAFFAGGVAGGFFASHIQDEPHYSQEELEHLLRTGNRTGEAYFRDGTLIGELRTDSHTYPVDVDDIAPAMVDALLATEDNEFFEHPGVNIRGVSRAVQEELLNPGQGTGGSTITQQLVKNQVVGPERTLDRKFREMALAMRVENMFEKEDILQAYLNIIYFGINANGANIEGIEAAAQGIFGVEASELNLAQSAYLAGMIQSPGRYTPFTRGGNVNDDNIERGERRAHWVLQRMIETGRITQEEYEAALAYDYKDNLAERSPRIFEEYPYLTYSIEDRASEILAEIIMDREGKSADDYEEGELEDLAKQELARGGYKVYTTIDQGLYDAFHEVADDHEFGPRSQETFTYVDPETGEEEERGYLEQSAATLIDNETGAILAMLEGRSFEESQIDFTNRPYQPGSAIKPVLDYAPAVEEGLLQPATALDDVPLFDYGEEPPRNFTNDYRGLGSLREYLTISQNVPAIQAFRTLRDEIGEDAVYGYVQRLGLSYITEEEIGYDSTAIGGSLRGWTVEEGTAAYATFANEGKYLTPHMIERIETIDGEVVFEHDPQPDEMFSPETAFLMNDMLRDVINKPNGTAHSVVGQQLGYTGLDIAGKTGTTNGQHDYWFIGYTPQVSLGLWTGYQQRNRLADGYSTRHQSLWVKLMQKVQELEPDYTDASRTFPEPEGIVRQEVCSKSGKLPSDLCRERGYLITDYFHPDHVPTEEDDVVVRERVVIVDGNRYVALDSTPDDLVEEGSKVYIKREPLNIPKEYEHERSRWLPNDWDNTALNEIDPREDNGRTPSSPSNVRASGSSITWDAVDEDDIAGYRVYNGNDEHVDSVPSYKQLRYQATSGGSGFYVTAVDIAGRESEPSSRASAQWSGDRQDDDSNEDRREEPGREEDRQEDGGQEDNNQEDSNQEDGSREDNGEDNEPEENDAPAGAPSAPSGVQVNGSMSGVTVTWNANPGNENVERYNVYVSTSSGFIQTGHSTSTSFQYTPKGSKNNQFYVTAVSAEGESSPSAMITIDLD